LRKNKFLIISKFHDKLNPRRKYLHERSLSTVKRILLGLCVFLLIYAAYLASSNVGSGQCSTKNMASYLDNYIVKIEVKTANLLTLSRPGSGIGSGVLGLDEQGRILTAFHVVDKMPHIFVTLSDGTRHSARVVKVDEEKDLALLEIDGVMTKFPTLKLLERSVVRGERVLVAGNTLGEGIGLYEGIVSLVSQGASFELIRTDITAPPGTSGGLLLKCSGSKVAGIVIQGLGNSQELAGLVGAISSNEVRDFLKD
jgi:S1-C subfamily serine protease